MCHILIGINHVHEPNIGFPEEQTEVLGPGELVIIDLDYIYAEDAQNIIWPDGASISKKLERKYKFGKNMQRLEKIKQRKAKMQGEER